MLSITGDPAMDIKIGNHLVVIPYKVGLGGFEPPTPSPPDLYAKPLRYNPNNMSVTQQEQTLA